jgi:TolB protein
MVLIGRSIRRPALLALGIAILIAAATAALQPAQGRAVATTGPAEPAIVFARFQGPPGNEDYEIWTMDRRGASQMRLTFNAVADHDPVWSPDGSHIAWVRYESRDNGGFSDLWLMDADGSNKHRLTKDHALISRPSWSPDGTRIAFTRDYGISIIRVDGTNEHRISAEGSFDFDPTWSPDGGTIAFVSQGAGTFDLFTMRADGSARRRLLRTRGLMEGRPASSPDGQTLAFDGTYRHTGWQLHLMNRDGTGLRAIVEPTSAGAAWFPDGSRLAFFGCVVGGECRLQQVRIDGRGLRPLGRIGGHYDIQPDIRRSA